ncbi:MAG: hypothetical protein AB7L09_13570 [Nitrospira sp.]
MWKHITEEDLVEIHGALGTFGTVPQMRYGDLHQEAVVTWANHRYSCWSGNYEEYKDAAPAS